MLRRGVQGGGRRVCRGLPPVQVFKDLRHGLVGPHAFHLRAARLPRSPRARRDAAWGTPGGGGQGRFCGSERAGRASAPRTSRWPAALKRKRSEKAAAGAGAPPPPAFRHSSCARRCMWASGCAPGRCRGARCTRRRGPDSRRPCSAVCRVVAACPAAVQLGPLRSAEGQPCRGMDRTAEMSEQDSLSAAVPLWRDPAADRAHPTPAAYESVIAWGSAAVRPRRAGPRRHLQRGDALVRRAPLHPYARRVHVQHRVLAGPPVAAHVQRLHALAQLAQQLRARARGGYPLAPDPCSRSQSLLRAASNASLRHWRRHTEPKCQRPGKVGPFS